MTIDTRLVVDVSDEDVMAEVLRRCLGIAENDNARQDFGDLNGGSLQRPTEVAAELVAALKDEGYYLARSVR